MAIPFRHMSLTVVAALSFSLIALAGDDMRTWSDSSGQYTIEAKFIGMERNKVILEKADGSRIQIDITKLKPEDRAEAIKLNAKKMSENPFKNEGDNPFKDAGKDAGKKTGSNRNRPEADPNAPAETSVDWNGVKQLSIFGSEWKAPSISPIDLKITWQPRPVVIQTKDFWDKATGLVAASAAKRAVVVTALDKPGNKDGATSTVSLCDLEKGNVIKEFTVGGKMMPLAISPDGTQVIARQEVFGQKSTTLELWTLSDSDLKRTSRWVAAQGQDMHGGDILGAAFIDGKTFITWLNNGQLTWWNAADAKPIQSLHLNHHNSSPSLSPDHKIIAARSDKEMVLLNANTGDTLSVKPMTEPAMNSRFAFSPDGKKLACIIMNKVDIYDLSTANQTHTMSTTNFGQDAPCFWTSPTALLAGQPLCFLAPDMNVNVWAYDGIEKLTDMGDYALILTSNQQRKGLSLVPLKLPHSSALQLVEQAKTDPNFFVIKPGTSVRIDTSGISDPAIKETTIDELTKKLEANGNKVGAGSVTLKASMEKAKDHEVAYRTFGSFNPPPRFGPGGFGQRTEKTHTVPGWAYHLKVVADGKTHWSMDGGNHPPPMIHLKEDETIESHLKQYGTPNANFFKFVELPKYVAKAQQDQQGGSSSLRRSQVTSSGIR